MLIEKNRKILQYIRENEGCSVYEIGKAMGMHAPYVTNKLAVIENDEDEGELFFMDDNGGIYIFDDVKDCEVVVMPEVEEVVDLSELPEKSWRYAGPLEDAVLLFERRYGWKPEKVWKRGNVYCVDLEAV